MEQEPVIEIEIDLSQLNNANQNTTVPNNDVAIETYDITEEREKQGIKKLSDQELLEKEKEL